jgi:uncharacterized protein YndB with AHSA1/START domain
LEKRLIAQASLKINASVDRIWEALINPEIIKQYMFGTEVVSSWKPGSSIVWKGVWKGKHYEDKGEILKIEPLHTIQYSHFSPLTGLADRPENYHTLTYKLSKEGNETLVTLSQDNNENENAKAHSEEMWQKLLHELKKVVEK